MEKWSEPKKATIYGGSLESSTFVVQFSVTEGQTVGAVNAQGPPVPIPNTEVKLCSAENTWLEAAREDKSLPTHYSVLYYIPR